MGSLQIHSHPLRERRARRLYERYGARPWQALDEPTREHFRHLVAVGMDGSGQPLPSRRLFRRRPAVRVPG